jgi:hypothetical protein
MSQVISGIRLGNGFSILFGTADPNASDGPADVKAAGVDYAYFRLGTGSGATWLYRCSQGATFENGVLIQAAVWTAT